MKRRLGEVLLERQQISPQELTEAVQEQQQAALRLGELLLQRGLPKPALVEALQEVTRVPYLDAATAEPEAAALALVPREIAIKHHVLPVGIQGNALVVILTEPQDLHLIDELQFLCGRDISPRQGFCAEIEAAIEKHYPLPEPEPVVEAVQEEEAEFFTAAQNERAQAAMREFQAELRHERTPAVRLVSSLFVLAAKRNASDVHVEPLTDELLVRLRVDGVLQEAMRVPGNIRAHLTSRLKILADMDIAEHRAPQDGRFLVRVGGRQFDIRASAIATQHGEKMVLRLLDPAAVSRGFADLGFAQQEIERLKRVLKQPQGMVLVTGPTGSGKTTTLYAALNFLRTPKVNIVTIEDPVEYMLEGVNQVQVSPKTGRSFADCLRSMLRQDPNVILVGEIRDSETAEIALQAAQTGHLVLSTMHTNDSVAALTRLLDLDVPAFLIASSLTAVVGQRLVRKLCGCKRQEVFVPERVTDLPPALARLDSRPFFSPAGCEQCELAGYRGRVGIYELLVLDEEIRAAMRHSVRDGEIRELARGAGMQLMQEDALQKVQQGITSVEEALRVVPFEYSAQRGCRQCRRLLAPAFVFCPYCSAAVANGEPSLAHLRRPKRKRAMA